MEINPLSSSPSPFQNAEQNLYEFSQEMVQKIEKLKEALNQAMVDPSTIKDPAHLQTIAETVVALDKASHRGQQTIRDKF